MSYILYINIIDSAIKSMGRGHLGVDKGNFSRHWIRSGGVMAMELDGVPTFKIILIDCWSNDALCISQVHL